MKKTIQTLNDKMWYRLLKVLHIGLVSLTLILGLILVVVENWNVEKKYYLDANTIVQCASGNMKEFDGYILKSRPGSSFYSQIHSGISEYSFVNNPSNYPLIEKNVESADEAVAFDIVKKCEDPDGIYSLEKRKPEYEIKDTFDNYEDFKAYSYDALYRSVLFIKNNPSYEGYGLRLKNIGQKLVISDVLAGSNAEISGMKIGDVIEEIGTESTVGADAEEVISVLREIKVGILSFLIFREESNERLTIDLENSLIKLDVKEEQKKMVNFISDESRAANEAELSFLSLLREELKKLDFDSANFSHEVLDEALKLNGVNPNYKFNQKLNYQLRTDGVGGSIEDILTYSSVLIFFVFLYHKLITIVFYYVYFGKVIPPQK